MANHRMCSLTRGTVTPPLAKMNGSTLSSRTHSMHLNRSENPVNKLSKQVLHTLWMAGSFGTAVPRQSWRRQQLSICSAMDASSMGGSDSVFPRINMQDPYERLGINREAGKEEIGEAHSYLVVQYGGHAKSMESIQSAYDEIMKEKWCENQEPQVKPKKEGKEMPAWMHRIADMYHVPKADVIAKTTAFYAALGLWTRLKPLGAGGPAFQYHDQRTVIIPLQVLLSFLACIYFLNARVKSLSRSFFIGFGTFVMGWFLSSFFVPPVPPYVLPSPGTLERTSSFISYTILWAACTFLR